MQEYARVGCWPSPHKPWGAEATGSNNKLAGFKMSAFVSQSAETKTPQHSHNVTLHMFVNKMLPLLELEKQAEIDASLALLSTDTAQKSGSVLKSLKCTCLETGLLGKTLIQLQSNTGELLPSHKLSTHDVVILKPSKGGSSAESLAQGVVYRIKENSVTVAVDDVPEEGLNSLLRLEKVANEVTYQRLKSTLVELGRGVSKGPAADLVSVLFGKKSPTFSTSKSGAFDPYNKGLDHSQTAAVQMALSSESVMLLHGPPGTGKTTALVEIILQEVKRASKVLACAASNIAVDNMVERLASHRVKIVRLGHPARLLPQVLDCALDAQVLKSDSSGVAKDIRKEINTLNAKIMKSKDRRTRDELRREVRQLIKEERQRQQRAVTDVIDSASVILTTLTGASSVHLQRLEFDLVVIDEAAQALEVACWIALLKGRRCILVGDHLQLAPTVQSKQAESQGFGKTLFERLAEEHSSAMTMLTVQYRMHQHIMDWSSHELYNGKMEAHESVAKRTLCELDGVERTPATQHTLVLIDICGCEMEESQDETDSSFNRGEAGLAITHTTRLVESGVKACDIGIITPYAAQVTELRHLRSQHDNLQDVEISTVDGFQGREKEAVVISMVRSNVHKEVGFLSDNRRMNVAVTRARRHCCIVCDTGTVGNNPFLKRLLDYFEKHGEYCYGMYY